MSDIRVNRWLHQSGTGGVYQDSTGRVGIGTSVPTSALDVQSGTIKIGNNTLSSSGVSTFTSVTSTTLNTTTLNVGTGGTIITTTTGGLVGIGTTNPNASLSISGTGGGSYLDIYNGGDIRLFPAGQHTGSAQSVSIYCDTSGEFVVGGNLKLASSGVILNSSSNQILKQTGGILQIVHDRDDTTYGTTSTSFQQITGISTSITPNNTSNRIYINFTTQFYHANSNGIHFSIRRNGISLVDTNTISFYHAETTNPDYRMVFGGIQIMDSPATTSICTYEAYYRSDTGGQVYINRPSNTTYTSRSGVFGSTGITLMEVVG
jgi:hypothetical protein